MKILVKLFNYLAGPPVNDEMEDVREFQRHLGQAVYDNPGHLTQARLRQRLEHLFEELEEFKDAVERQHLADQADALVDLVYLAKGTAAMLGLPWEDLWRDVHDANMEKLPGVTKRGHAVDAVKPAGWVPPQTELILRDAGYHRTAYLGRNNQVAEERCRA